MRTSLSVLALAAVAAAHEDVLQACDPLRGGASARPGFDLTIWNYPWTSYNHQTNRGVPDRTTFESAAYLQGGYAQYEELGRARAVTNLTFVNEFELGRGREMVRGRLPPNYNFPDEFNISNFAYLATGYFRAEQDGAYNFTLDFVDDYASVALGGGRAFDCCQKDTGVKSPEGFQIDARWARNGPVGRAWTVVNLQRGAYYPLRVFYVNTNNWAGIRFTFTDPSGVHHEDFQNHIFHFDDQPNECPEIVATTTQPYDGTETVTAYTTLSTYTNSDNQLTTGRVVVINTPYPRGETTTTNGWTGSYTTTLSTGVATVTGTDGYGTIETTYYVVTPEAVVSTTTTSGWTGTHTTTLSTGLTTVTGPDGIATTETTYYVVTPEAQAVTTTTSGWTGSFTTTMSTGVTTVTGSDGIATTETIYHVVTPEAQAVTTTTRGWAGNHTTTLSTAVATVTGTDGIATTETIYHVVTPEAQAVTTTTRGWAGNHTTTLSTAVATVTGTDGIATTETIYHVVTPEALSVTKTAIFSSGSSWQNVTAEATKSSSFDGRVNQTIDSVAGTHTQISESLTTVTSSAPTEDVCASLEQETVTVILSPMTTMTIPTTGAPQVMTIVKTVYSTITKDYSEDMSESPFEPTTVSAPTNSAQVSSTNGPDTQQRISVDELAGGKLATTMNSSAANVSSQFLENTIVPPTSEVYTSGSSRSFSLGNTDEMVTILPIGGASGISGISIGNVSTEPSTVQSSFIAVSTGSAEYLTGTSEQPVTATPSTKSSVKASSFQSETKEDTNIPISVTSISYSSSGTQASRTSTAEYGTAAVTGIPESSGGPANDNETASEEAETELPEESYGQEPSAGSNVATTEDEEDAYGTTVVEEYPLPTPQTAFTGSGFVSSAGVVSSSFPNLTKPLLPFFGGAVQLNTNMNKICSALVFVVTTLLL
ncbi:AFL092Cp [Eremothecium gossypii ATCC 10895]|uniref:AFL092Cp n=1 Tax=Eremothecium gossypii (strain ATCC 10895 / CBS 109.51 / FGSC 9923 / NRRL Y-1056) TaxID=284811 RepID=Q755B7_EREGS|nr:AFL092Cp [Eremothecium gossypii ATCC 10895]AAS53280.2 AFL092Cp [Eremothecium gossypii ATCC 10895]